MPRNQTTTREPLSDEEREALLAKDRTGLTLFDRNACQHCGGMHLRKCPKIKLIEFHANGQVSRVEFWAWGEWPDDDIIWPEEVFGDFRPDDSLDENSTTA